VNLNPALYLPDVFNESVPNSFQEDILKRVILKGYNDAADEAETKYESEQAHDVRGHIRRVMIDGLLKNIPSRHIDIKAFVESNNTRSAYHVLLRCGQIALTQSLVISPRIMVSPSRFRETYARNYQLPFDSLDNHTQVDPSNGIYAIIIHAPIRTHPKWPRFVHAVFPNADYTGYIDRIDLLAKFRDLPELRATETEVISDIIDLGIKKTAKESGG
jgi:hypothetical protein